MAIVRITDTITREILAKVDTVFAPELGKAKLLDLPETCTGDAVYDRMFAPWKDAMAAIPLEMMGHGREFVITKVAGHECRHTFQMSTVRVLPLRLPADPHVATDSYTGAQYKLNGAEYWSDLCAVVCSRNGKVHNVAERTKKFKDGVEQVLKSHATLAPALKAWPPLWDILPAHIQDKHKEIKERKTVVATPEVATDHLTAMLTVIKLTR